MKKTLLSLFALSLGLSSIAQNNGDFQVDQNGKTYFKMESISGSSQQQGNIAPLELNLDWSNPDFDVSNHPTVDSWDPRLAVDNTGNAYVVYNDNHPNGLQKIMFRKRNVDGSWTDPIFVDKGGEIESRNNHFPAIAAAPNGDLHVIYNVWAFENVRNYIGYSYYNAATNTWNDGVKISDEGGTVNHTSSHHDLYVTNDNKPVVVWGYDFRENQVNEEIYMKYNDGSNWSADIAVSDVSDGSDAGNPYIKSIGDNKAMILYSEFTTSGGRELRYRIYDEITHELSTAMMITDANIFSNNYALVSSPTGDVMVLSIYKTTNPNQDVLQIFDYDRGSDSFSLSSNVFEIAANAGGLLKRIAMDCNSGGDCGVIYTDLLNENISFLEYNKDNGFGTPLVIVNENPGFEEPSALFDPSGNLHLVWNDYRFDDGQGFDEREVMYKQGVNLTIGIEQPQLASIEVYPNPTTGFFNIKSPKIYSMEIFDVLGRKIANSDVLQGITPMEINLKSGTYFLKFSDGTSSQIKKLLVSQ